MMTFPTFKTLQTISPKMAQFPIASSAQKQISEVTPKGHTLADSFDRVGAGEKRGLNLSDFTRMGRTIGTNIDGESGRQGANAKTGIESVGAGFPSSKDILGSLEPGADLASGVENGSVDKPGNASSVPTFGVDSRVAAETNDCSPAEFWESTVKGGVMAGATSGGACLVVPASCPSVRLAVTIGAGAGWLGQAWDCAKQELTKEDEKTEKAKDEKKATPTAEPDGCDNAEEGGARGSRPVSAGE